jgi:hypothetical protein
LDFVVDQNGFRQVKTILRRFVAIHGETHTVGLAKPNVVLARPMAWVLPVRQVILQRVSPLFIFSGGSTEMERKEDPYTYFDFLFLFLHFNFLQFFQMMMCQMGIRGCKRALLHMV